MKTNSPITGVSHHYPVTINLTARELYALREAAQDAAADPEMDSVSTRALYRLSDALREAITRIQNGEVF